LIVRRTKTKPTVPLETESTKEMADLIRQACLVAKDSASNAGEFIDNSSKMAFLAVKDCEKELDRIERRIDEQLASAITEVTESEARELLACLKFIIDLERIGDLTWSVTKRLHTLGSRLLPDDADAMSAMAKVLEEMLERIYQGFVTRDTTPASWVIQADARIDETCRGLFSRHLTSSRQRTREYSTSLLLMAQAFERAGDHAKNLAEEVFHLVEGRSLRHELKRHKLDK
jgi:phosphate transport system protein